MRYRFSTFSNDNSAVPKDSKPSALIFQQLSYKSNKVK